MPVILLFLSVVANQPMFSVSVILEKYSMNFLKNFVKNTRVSQ